MDSIDRIIFRPTNWIVDTTGTTVSNLGIEIRNVSCPILMYTKINGVAMFINFPGYSTQC